MLTHCKLGTWASGKMPPCSGKQDFGTSSLASLVGCLAIFSRNEEEVFLLLQFPPTTSLPLGAGSSSPIGWQESISKYDPDRLSWSHEMIIPSLEAGWAVCEWAKPLCQDQHVGHPKECHEHRDTSALSTSPSRGPEPMLPRRAVGQQLALPLGLQHHCSHAVCRETQGSQDKMQTSPPSTSLHDVAPPPFHLPPFYPPLHFQHSFPPVPFLFLPCTHCFSLVSCLNACYPSLLCLHTCTHPR